MRWKLTLQYDGLAFHGWQSQQGVVTVQDELERALYSLCQTDIRVHVSGRTDTGVHALGQVAHADIPRDLPPDRMRLAIQAHLHAVPIAVVSAEPVADDFHARFGAKMRHYRYRILQSAFPPVLERNRAWWLPFPLDVAAMQEGGNHFLGYHDFSSFRASGCQAQHALRSIEHVRITQHQKDDMTEIWAEFRARSFLYHQVRNMVGTLAEVGLGQKTPNDVAVILAACDRTKAGRTAPAEGLYFTKVDF